MDYITSFLLLFVRPRKAIHFFVDLYFSLPILISLVVVSGIINGIMGMNIGLQTQSLGLFLGINEIILSIIMALALWFAMSFLIYIITKKRGSVATFQDVRTIMVWTALTGSIISVFFSIILFFGGFLVLFVNLGTLWGLWIIVSAISEVTHVKFWKMAGIMVVVGFIVSVPYFLLVWQTGYLEYILNSAN